MTHSLSNLLGTIRALQNDIVNNHKDLFKYLDALNQAERVILGLESIGVRIYIHPQNNERKPTTIKEESSILDGVDMVLKK